MSLQALAQEKFWANKAECEDAEKAYYMRLSGAKREAPKDEDDDFDLFASDEDKAEVAESPKKVAKIEPKKANKGQKQKSAVKPVAKKEESDDDFDLFASSDEDKPPSKPSKKQKQGSSKSSSSLASEIAKARQHIKNSLECVDNIAAKAGGVDPNILKKINDLEIENKNLKKVTEDLLARVAALELSGGAPKAAAPAAAPSKKVEEEDDDEEVDLFGSDSDSEDDAEKARVREERLAAYHAKKAKKPALIAKTSVVLDIKPWDDETDMDAMLKNVKTIVKEGLLWGASKLVPVGYGINKLRVMCVVEDEKVSIDELCEQIAEFEDFVQSVDIDSMSKI